MLSEEVKILFVVKANAYGHGITRIAREAESLLSKNKSPIDWFGVSSVEEGITLRQAGVKTPILILGSLYPFDSFIEAARFRLIPTIASLEAAKKISEVGLKIRKKLDCHLKIDTGMGRIGISPENASGVAKYLLAQQSARLGGIYTHFASAENDPGFTRLQISRFKMALSDIGLKNGKIIVHASNSAAILKYPAARFDMVRAGLALYGLSPGFRPVLSFKARIVFIKKIKKNTPISYGGTFRARRTSRIATVCVGYGDGVLRSQSNKGWALVEGHRCKMVGAITMDMLMLDVTDTPEAHVGSEVVLIGTQGKERILAQDAAQTAGTISYEILCAISQRVPRVYIP